MLDLIVLGLIVSVGTNMGDVMVWELGRRERIATKNFKVWELSTRSVGLQVWVLSFPSLWNIKVLPEIP